jgi:hypothetical protein
MKPIFRLPILLLVAFALLTLTGCVGVPDLGPGLVVGQSYRLDSGETLNTDLTVIGGNANIHENSTVNGDVVVIGGNVTIDGRVNGDLSVMGGSVFLDDNAEIQGSVESLGGTVQRASGAVVEGQDMGNRGDSRRITTVRNPAFNISFEPVTATLMAIFQALALAALAIVINLFAPRPMERTGLSAAAQPVTSGGVGCLTILVLLVMAITIILLPISLLGFLVVGVAALFGWAALGLIFGRRLSVWLNQSWSDPVNAGVGTLTLSLLASLLNIIPCVGWVISFVVGLVALGAVVLSRFGTQLYSGPAAPASYTPAPYQPGPYTPPPAAGPSGAMIYPESEPPTETRVSGPEDDVGL